MPKHVFKKLHRELKISVDKVRVLHEDFTKTGPRTGKYVLH